MALAIIPARGGSKGVKRKNLRKLAGKSLLEHTICSAMESRLVSEIFLSSDDEEIIEEARYLGLNVEYVRPYHLAGDEASMIDVVNDALVWINKNELKVFPKSVVVLQPTSPLRNSNDVDSAISYLDAMQKINYVVGVNKMKEHPYECIFQEDSGWDFLAKPHAPALRRQDYYEKYFFINGSIYAFNVDSFLREKRFIKLGETKFYEMPIERSIDIDTEADLAIAECLYDFKKITY
jgi:CMP-N,N'-diacetyllegionaminic acid synthase